MGEANAKAKADLAAAAAAAASAAGAARARARAMASMTRQEASLQRMDGAHGRGSWLLHWDGRVCRALVRRRGRHTCRRRQRRRPPATRRRTLRWHQLCDDVNEAEAAYMGAVEARDSLKDGGAPNSDKALKAARIKVKRVRHIRHATITERNQACRQLGGIFGQGRRG